MNWTRVMQVIRTIGAVITSGANLYFIYQFLHGRR